MGTHPGHAERLSTGLSEEARAQYQRDGFVIVRGVFAPDEVEAIRAVCDAHLADYQTEVDDGAGRSYRVAIWTRLDESLVGRLPRIERVVGATEALLGERCYHWHSKILRKLPGDGAVSIHQDYATWYEDGCLSPQLMTCTIAIDRSHPGNGGMYMVPGSHRMARFHRVRLGEGIDTHGADPVRVAEAIARNGRVTVDLEPGDILLFHCKTLHGSGPNVSDEPRTVVHCSYNAVGNQPIPLPGQAHHRFRPLARVADDYLRRRDYAAPVLHDTFHGAETHEAPGAGIFFRARDADVGPTT